ncbi:MAG: hypothetical protein ACK4N5_21190, partial [Myxococcales bacterium]
MRPPRSRLLACTAALLAALLPAHARAHALDMGLLELTVEGERLEAELLLSTVSWASLAPLDVSGDGLIAAEELEEQVPAMFLATFGQSP